MPKIVCVTCEVEYRIVKSGGYVIEYFGRPPRPCKVWSVDGWQCRGCGHKVMAGFGNGPLGEHFEQDFNDLLEKVKLNDWVVNDYEYPHQAIAKAEGGK